MVDVIGATLFRLLAILSTAILSSAISSSMPLTDLPSCQPDKKGAVSFIRVLS
jgi:hypothetical protein